MSHDPKGHPSARPTRTVIGLCLLLAGMLLAPPPTEAAPHVTWVPLQTSTWADGFVQPDLGFRILAVDYVNAVQIPLNNFNPDGQGPPQPSNFAYNPFDYDYENGLLYLTVSDIVPLDPPKCIPTVDGIPQSDASCDSRTLFIGMKVDRQTTGLGFEKGSLTIYIDADRATTLAGMNCFPNGSNKPDYEDRKIVIEYDQPDLSEEEIPVTSVKQFRGTCDKWQSLDPALEDLKFPTRINLVGESSQRLHFRIEIELGPASDAKTVSEPIASRMFGLAIVHRLPDAIPPPYQYPSFGHFPSVWNGSPWSSAFKPADADVMTWETIDLRAPTPLSLRMSAYNIGQLQITDDGGQAEMTDFANILADKDVVCLVEVMNGSERDELIEEINVVRENNGLSPYNYFAPPGGDPPNNVILSAGPIVASGYVLYGDLPGNIDCEDDECIGDGAGWKGIVWARIGLKKVGATKVPGVPVPNDDVWTSDDFVDVFCTHTQADYDEDGQYAWVRGDQFPALKAWSDEKRAGGGQIKNGLRYPAFVMGDLNQLGPKAVPNEPLPDPIGFVDDWIASHTEKGFGPEYQAMRSTLGNLARTEFDLNNGYSWDQYDMLSRQTQGTWIGDETETTTSDTSANECTNTFPDMRLEGRLDYIMVLPAQVGVNELPFYAIVNPDADQFPGEPLVGADKHVGDWYDGFGCASDHAEVTAHVGLVRLEQQLHYNPNKTHQITYQITHLWDMNNADSTAFDDGSTDWYIPKDDFRMVSTSADPSRSWVSGLTWTPDEVTGDGRSYSPSHWLHTLDISGTEKLTTYLFLGDYDDFVNDAYDGEDISAGVKDARFRFDHAYPGTWFHVNPTNGTTVLVGNMDPTTLDPSASCADGCTVYTRGDGSVGEEDAKVTHKLLVKEK